MIKTLILAFMVTFNLFTILLLLLNTYEAWIHPDDASKWWSLVYLTCAVSVFGMMVMR